MRKWVIIVREAGIPVISGKENPVYQLAVIALNSRVLQLYTLARNAKDMRVGHTIGRISQYLHNCYPEWC